MDFFRIVVALVTFYQLLPSHAVKARTLSKEEDAELERELRTINKPPVKTIKTMHGDIYDCVRTYEQPALDHPLLKNHKVQISPSSALLRSLGASSNKPSSSTVNLVKIGFENGCPEGTVLIQRTSKEVLIRAKSHFGGLVNLDDDSIKPGGAGYEIAGIQSKFDANKKFYGIGGNLNIYQPAVTSQQMSGAMIMLQSGGPGSIEYIQTGWMVNQDLYNDTLTRWFSKWMHVNNGFISGCYNAYCPGFVVTTTSIALNAFFPNVSRYFLGPLYEYRTSIIQDPSTGHMWLLVNNDTIKIGYWPKELFTKLVDGADKVFWGGMVYSSTDRSPPMGSGYFKNGLYEWTCYVARVNAITEKGAPLTDVDPSLLQNKVSRCYRADDYHHVDTAWGYRFNFGGRGGNKKVCIDIG